MQAWTFFDDAFFDYLWDWKSKPRPLPRIKLSWLRDTGRLNFSFSCWPAHTYYKDILFRRLKKFWRFFRKATTDLWIIQRINLSYFKTVNIYYKRIVKWSNEIRTTRLDKLKAWLQSEVRKSSTESKQRKAGLRKIKTSRFTLIYIEQRTSVVVKKSTPTENGLIACSSM